MKLPPIQGDASHKDLSGPSISLRLWTVDDEEDYVTLVRENPKELGQWFSWASPDYSGHQFREWLSTFSDDSTFLRQHFSIAAEGVVCGSIGFWRINTTAVELEYWLTRSHWGAGVALQAVGLVEDYVSRLGFWVAEIHYKATNYSSARLARRAGYKPYIVYSDRAGKPGVLHVGSRKELAKSQQLSARARKR